MGSEDHPAPGSGEARPREKLRAMGASALADEELLALILGTGYSGCDVMSLAREILGRYPGEHLWTLSVERLSAIKGVGPGRAAAITAAFALAERWLGPFERLGQKMDSPRCVYRELQDLLELSREHFVALYLNAGQRMIHRETVSIGTLTTSLVHPREVFSPAIGRRAASLVVAHNHPSGDPSPSPEDRQATRRLSEAGQLLGIPLVDHVIIGGGRYYSFMEQGELLDTKTT